MWHRLFWRVTALPGRGDRSFRDETIFLGSGDRLIWGVTIFLGGGDRLFLGLTIFLVTRDHFFLALNAPRPFLPHFKAFKHRFYAPHETVDFMETIFRPGGGSISRETIS